TGISSGKKFLNVASFTHPDEIGSHHISGKVRDARFVALIESYCRWPKAKQEDFLIWILKYPLVHFFFYQSFLYAMNFRNYGKYSGVGVIRKHPCKHS